MDNMQVNHSSQISSQSQASSIRPGPTLDLPGGGSAQIMSGQAFDDLLTMEARAVAGDGKGDDVARLMEAFRAAIAGGAPGSNFRLI